MSILIKGIGMPKNCCECFAFKSNASGQLFCKAKRTAFGKEDAEWSPKRTPNWCPLVELPPHGRLVDVNAILNEPGNCFELYGHNKFYRETILQNALTVIEAEDT